MLKFIIIALIIILALIILFSIGLIKASKKATKNKENLTDKIRQTISTARQIQFKAEAEIENLKLKANHAIYQVIEPYISELNIDTTTLFENYDSIHQHLKDKIDPTQLQQLENIVKGYQAQIELKKIEQQTAKNIEEKYQTLYEDLQQAKKQKQVTQALKKHEENLKKLSQDISNTKKLIEASYDFDILSDEVKHHLNTLKALKELQIDFNDTDYLTSTNQQTYKEEMDKLVNKLNYQQNDEDEQKTK